MFRFRQSVAARILVRLLLALWLLPQMLAAVPSPATAAEQGLYADLVASRCLDMNSDGLPDPGPGKHDCCLTCAPAKLVQPRVLPPVRIVFQQHHVSDPPWIALDDIAARPDILFRPLSQRGPPA